MAKHYQFKHRAVFAQPKSDTCWTKYILLKEYFCLPLTSEGRRHFHMAVVAVAQCGRLWLSVGGCGSVWAAVAQWVEWVV